PPPSHDVQHPRPTPLAGRGDTQSADSNSTLIPTDSPTRDSSLVFPVARSIGAPHRPNAFPSSENQCHPRSTPPLLPASAWPATPVCALLPISFHRSTAP